VTASSDASYNPGSGPRDRSLRVGDKEREAVGEILRRRHVEGRLDTDELEERLGRCLAAKTYAQLDELIADFPREPDGRSRPREFRHGWVGPRPFLILPAIVIAVVAFGGHVAWLAVPLFFFFVVRTVVWRAWAGGYRHGRWGSGPRSSL
jgi:hypothetical protein